MLHVCSKVCRCRCSVCGSIWGREQQSPGCSCCDGTDRIQPGQPYDPPSYSDAASTSDLRPWWTLCTWWGLWQCQHNSCFHHGNKSSLLVFNFHWDLQCVLWLFPEAWIVYSLDRLDGTVRCQRVSSVLFELPLGSMPRVPNVSPYEASPEVWGGQARWHEGTWSLCSVTITLYFSFMFIYLSVWELHIFPPQEVNIILSDQFLVAWWSTHIFMYYIGLM